MKYLLIGLLLLPTIASAYATVYNPFTGKLDYVGISTPMAAPTSTPFQVQFTSADGKQFSGSNNLIMNGSTFTISGVVTMTKTNVSTEAYTGTYFDLTGSSLTVTGFRLLPLTKAQINAWTPTGIGEYYPCSDCSTVTTCTSTSAVRGGVSLITNKASACQ